MRRELEDGFELDDDPARIDVDAVHAFISGESYWGRGRPRELVERAIRGSLRVVGLYDGGEQVGFARAVSDGVTVAYLADVYVLPALPRPRPRRRARARDRSTETPMRSPRRCAGCCTRPTRRGCTRGSGSSRTRARPPAYPLMERGRGYDSRP